VAITALVARVLACDDRTGCGRPGRCYLSAVRGRHQPRHFGHALFSRRIGRNEAFNHLGNAVAAIVAGIAGYLIQPVAVLWVVVALALASTVAVYTIDGNSIDHELARGADDGNAGEEQKRLGQLLESRPLLLFTAAITLFHFANAAMLPLLGEKLSQSHQEASSLFMAACIITAQVVMVPMALLVGHKADGWGRKPRR